MMLPLAPRVLEMVLEYGKPWKVGALLFLATATVTVAVLMAARGGMPMSRPVMVSVYVDGLLPSTDTERSREI